MQIIQGIRDKGAAIVIGVIALSLIGFILMDAKQGNSNIFDSNSTEVGEVDGSSIDLAEFNKKVRLVESQEEQRSNQKVSPTRAAEIRQQVWDQFVNEKIFYSEAAKLGINFTSKELSTILASEDPQNPLMQDPQMLDSATGKMDLGKLKQALANIRKAKGEQRDMIDAQIVDPQKLTSISTKYYSLLSASAYYPSWMEESDAKDRKTFATISYVAIPFADISDSAIKVSDAEIEAYVKKHKELFKQEAGRKISYVTFSQLPSSADSARTRDAVVSVKEQFAVETNMNKFLARNTSSIAFDSNYQPKSKITSIAIDSILKAPAGTVYGPYVDKGSFVLARLLGSKSVYDSVRAKHILIPTINPQTGQPELEDSVAKKRADSILAVINAGGSFTDLAKQFSSDGSKDKGGDLGSFAYGTMVPEFNEFCFNKPVGSRGVVKTQFGYHVIEVLNQKGSASVYKVAFMGKEILADETTINKASLDATKLSAEKDSKKLDAYLQKNNLSKISESSLIKENDSRIGQLTDARQLVRWVFDAKQGEVSEPFSLGEQFVVAILDKIEKEGTQDIQTARPMAERSVREEKKAAAIIAKLGNNPTPESAAAAYGKQVLTAGSDSSITFSSTLIPNLGPESKVIGACFNKANLNKVVPPIIGKTGVFVIQVTGIGEKAPESPEKAAETRTQTLGVLRSQAGSGWFDDLKKRAKIKDNRSDFY